MTGDQSLHLCRREARKGSASQCWANVEPEGVGVAHIRAGGDGQLDRFQELVKEGVDEQSVGADRTVCLDGPLCLAKLLGLGINVEDWPLWIDVGFALREAGGRSRSREAVSLRPLPAFPRMGWLPQGGPDHADHVPSRNPVRGLRVRVPDPLPRPEAPLPRQERQAGLLQFDDRAHLLRKRQRVPLVT